MPRAATQTTTKAATKSANAKTKADKADKPKREPSAYNKYMAEQVKLWRADNPDVPYKEAFAAVAQKWRDAPENPKRGQAPAAKKAGKENTAKATKAAAKKPKSKKKEASSEEEEEMEGGDDDEE